VIRVATFAILSLFAAQAFAQTYSGGLPLTVNATNPSVGTNNASAPASSTQIGFRDANGKLQPFQGSGGSVAITGTVTASQGTSPWVTSRNWVLQGATDSVGVTGTVAATQSTSPWVTSRNWVLQGSTDSVGVTGTVTAARSWVLQGSTDSVGVTGTVTTSAPSVASASVSRVANSASNFTLVSSNASRKGLFLYNDSSTNCYVKFGATATTSSFTVKMFSTDTYIMDPPAYTGIVDAICDAASGSTQVSEL
jgi:hypothetical protein